MIRIGIVDCSKPKQDVIEALAKEHGVSIEEIEFVDMDNISQLPMTEYTAPITETLLEIQRLPDLIEPTLADLKETSAVFHPKKHSKSNYKSHKRKKRRR